MFRVFVGYRYLAGILGYQRFRLLCKTHGSKLYDPFATKDRPDGILQQHDLAKVTVFEVLAWFHDRLSNMLKADPATILNAQREEIERVAREDYFCEDFACVPDHACNSLAIHGIFPHGQTRRDGNPTPAFLPDFSLGVRCFGFFGRAPRKDRGLSTVGLQISQTSDDIVRSLCGSFPRVPTSTDLLFSSLECHLCDTLATVHKRAIGFWNKYKSFYSFEKLTHAKEGDGGDDHDHIFIDAIVHGFPGHRSLRRDNSEVTSIGMNRLLAASATRQSLGKQVISAILPVATWQQLKPPVRHFLLQAGEEVAGATCAPIYPNLPPRDVMTALVEAIQLDGAIIGENGDGVEYEYCFDQGDVEQHSLALRQLGFDLAVRRRLGISSGQSDPGGSVGGATDPTTGDGPEPLRKRVFRPVDLDGLLAKTVWTGEWQEDWKAAILELHSAFYDNDIERSLNLQRVLDLYPLHKRVLGLVEHEIVRELKRRGMTGGASSVFSKAYTGRSIPGLVQEDEKRATLETEGNWLIFAHEELLHGSSDPLALASMLDAVVAKILGAPEFIGIRWTINLASGSAADHAKQIFGLSQPSKEARLMSFYLGKLALMLRNAIEHGSDEVDGETLLIHHSGYWQEMRPMSRRYKPVLAWDKDIARSNAVQWRSRARLSKILNVPSGANGLRLTLGSLHRCLKLVSLVLLSSDTHLGLNVS